MASYRDMDCGIAKALSVFGDPWSLLILRNAFHGMRTFDAFQQQLKISTSVLRDRLKRMEDAGIFQRQRDEEDGRSFAYNLTEAGLDLYPIIVAFKEWGERWDPHPDGERMILIDKATNTPIRGIAVLGADGREVSPKEVRPVAGPGASEETVDLIASNTANKRSNSRRKAK